MQMTIIKLVLVGLLATSSVFASAIKGLSSEQEPKALKGVERLVSAPVEYQRRSEWSKASEPKLEQQRVELSKAQERDEQQQLQQLPEQLKLEEQREEQLIVTQQKEELPPPTKTLRYEAKPQVEQQYESLKELKREEAPLKGQAKKEEPSKFIEQQRVEATASYEQLQQQQLKEQVELRDYEQRKLEDQQAAAVQFQQQQQQQQFEEQRQMIAKGASKEPIAAQAPLQSAEPEPYAFEYAIEGSSRRESGDAQGVVRGQYTLQQADGTSRVVDYVADRDGFRAQVNTNEFGTESQAPLAVPSAGVKGAPAPAAPAAVKGAPLAAQLPEIKQEPLKQEIAYVEEVPRAVKGVKLIEQAEIKAEVKAPAKGQQQQEPLKGLDEPAAQAELLPAPVVKSAELRSPKAMGATLKTRSGFESATAHRPVVGVLRHEYTHSQLIRESPLVVAHQQPQRHYVAPARHYSIVRPVAPVAHYPRHQPSAAASLLRSQLQHDRYLPTPIQPIVNRAPTNSRAISFYSTSNNAETNEDLPIGFEKSA